MRWVSLPAVLTLAGVLFIDGSASADWQPIERLSRTVTGNELAIVSQPAIASGGGVQTVVWRRQVDLGRYVLEVAQRSLGQWGRPHAVLTGPLVSQDVAMDGAGNTMVVTCDENNGQILARELPRGGRWSPPEVLVAEGCFTAEVVMDAQGNAIVADTLLGERSRVRAMWRPAGGDWTTPQIISPRHTNVETPKVALSNGVATFAWQTGDIGGRVEVRRMVHGRLSDVKVLFMPQARDLLVEVDVSDDARTVVWWRANGPEDVVSARHWSNGRWGRTRRIAADGLLPQVASNDRGRTIVTFVRESADGDRLFSRRLRSSRWSPPRLIARTRADRSFFPLETFALSLNNRGVATMVWGRGRLGVPARCRLQVARQPSGRGWSAAVDLARFRSDILFACPSPALTTEGTTLAWRRRAELTPSTFTARIEARIWG